MGTALNEKSVAPATTVGLAMDRKSCAEGTVAFLSLSPTLEGRLCHLGLFVWVPCASVPYARLIRIYLKIMSVTPGAQKIKKTVGETSFFSSLRACRLNGPMVR